MNNQEENDSPFKGFSFGEQSASGQRSPNQSDIEYSSEEEYGVNYTDYEDAFNYDNLNKNEQISYGNFFAFEAGLYIKFGYKGDDKKFNTSKNNVGWKLHISIDKSQVGVAWDSLLPIFIKHKIGMLKIRNNAEVNEDEREQIGKEITIYAFIEPEIMSWRQILTEINEALVTNNITPSTKPQYNIEVQGSDYLSYRNDDDGNGNYLPASSLTETPVDTGSPFQNIIIESSPVHGRGVQI